MMVLKRSTSVTDENPKITAIAIGRGRSTQFAVKWAVENLLPHNISHQCILLHVQSYSLHPRRYLSLFIITIIIKLKNIYIHTYMHKDVQELLIFVVELTYDVMQKMVMMSLVRRQKRKPKNCSFLTKNVLLKKG